MAINSMDKGKSGSAKIITWVQVIEENCYLLSIYEKAKKDLISNKDVESYPEDAKEESKRCGR